MPTPARWPTDCGIITHCFWLYISSVNPDLASLQPYPFERLRQLFAQPTPAISAQRPAREIKLSIGEPQHATPGLIIDALAANLHGLAIYPTTQGIESLRQAISAWVARRYNIPAPNPDTELLPVNGSREALFAFTQTVIARQAGAKVICPNPFYQIYEGAALLAGATPIFLNTLPANDYAMDWSAIDAQTWRDVQLVFVCSPGNPTGKVMALDDWRTLFALADTHDFVIAADECYSEIYLDEAHPPRHARWGATTIAA
jgi:N-succinyldiaminopimelate aminotransferase